MTLTIAEAALAISESLVVSILVKASILLALGLLAAWVTTRSRAALRHFVLASAFGALVILPIIAASNQRLFVEISMPADSKSSAGGTASTSSAAPLFAGSTNRAVLESAGSWVLSGRIAVGVIWIAGAVIFLLPLVVNVCWLRGLRRNGLPWPELRRRTESLAAQCGIRRPIEVLLHESTPTPLMSGFWRPVIILPSDARGWSEAELRCVIAHELEHARRGDWITQLLARAVCACYWFHPLVWVGWRRLCLEAERACDDAVLQSEEHTNYAEQLVTLARRMSRAHAQPALGMANRSDLSKRISAVLDATQDRGRAGLLPAAGALVAAGLIVIVLAPLHLVAQVREGQQSGSNSSASARRQANRSSALDRALYEAAENGEISDIEKLLQAGANVNCTLSGDGSPLIGAAREGHLEAVNLLLQRGADPNMPVRGDGNPLIMAAREGHTTVVALLLDRGAHIDEVVPGDENALIQASGSGQLDAVKLLVSRGANVNGRVWVDETWQNRNGEWRTPLGMARKGHHAKVVEYLLSLGARE